MNHPFDEFSKSLTDRSFTRRESLRALIGALIAPLVVRAEPASANPDSRPRRRRAPRQFKSPGGGNAVTCDAFCKKCPSKAKREQCLAACRACNSDPKRLSGACGDYACCAQDLTPCGGRCTNLRYDVNNCGACGHACTGGRECLNGTCSECPVGQTTCGSTCVNLFADSSNCGACGNRCSAPTPYCSDGLCSQCPWGFVLCGSVCTDIYNDESHCGGCGNACDPGGACMSGVCDYGVGGCSPDGPYPC